MTFEELYEEYAGVVYGYLMFKLKDGQLAEDVLQETFLAVHQSTERLHAITAPKAWLLSIAHNKMVDMLRKKTSSPKESIAIDAIGDGENNPASDLFFIEALTQLPEVERTIIYGLYAEGMTCQELAHLLEIPAGTVKSKAHYARKRLYRWLKEGSA